MSATATDVKVYVFWLVAVIMGRLNEADQVMAQHRRTIYRAAEHLRKACPPPVRKLYRGLLLEPELVKNGFVQPHPYAVESVSFTEDRNVACYFADPQTIMSGFVKQIRPRVLGYIAELTPRPSSILWHYAWNPIARRIDVHEVARQHPLIEDSAQFDHIFRTQREVILKPLTKPLRVQPLDDCPDATDLDNRFTPPHLRHAF